MSSSSSSSSKVSFRLLTLITLFEGRTFSDGELELALIVLK